MLDPSKRLALAEQVSKTAESLGIQTALIGAAALAVNGYARGTEDIDLAAAVPIGELRRLLTAYRAVGLRAELRVPHEEDALGGVLVVWATEDEEGSPADVVEVVNFLNPLRQEPIRRQRLLPGPSRWRDCNSAAWRLRISLHSSSTPAAAGISPTLSNSWRTIPISISPCFDPLRVGSTTRIVWRSW